MKINSINKLTIAIIPLVFIGCATKVRTVVPDNNTTINATKASLKSYCNGKSEPACTHDYLKIDGYSNEIIFNNKVVFAQELSPPTFNILNSSSDQKLKQYAQYIKQDTSRTVSQGYVQAILYDDAKDKKMMIAIRGTDTPANVIADISIKEQIFKPSDSAKKTYVHAGFFHEMQKLMQAKNGITLEEALKNKINTHTPCSTF